MARKPRVPPPPTRYGPPAAQSKPLDISFQGTRPRHAPPPVAPFRALRSAHDTPSVPAPRAHSVSAQAKPGSPPPPTRFGGVTVANARAGAPKRSNQNWRVPSGTVQMAAVSDSDSDEDDDYYSAQVAKVASLTGKEYGMLKGKYAFSPFATCQSNIRRLTAIKITRPVAKAAIETLINRLYALGSVKDKRSLAGSLYCIIDHHSDALSDDAAFELSRRIYDHMDQFETESMSGSDADSDED